MRSFFGSLYGRISAIFLVLLLVLSMVQLWVGVQSARNFSRESDQSLNRNLAADLARTFQPALEEGLDRPAIARHIHDMMVFNPRLEIYVLDAQGRVLA
ncbi:MAG TPA: two-component sensor histidine kinase, partial [bacterium]